MKWVRIRRMMPVIVFKPHLDGYFFLVILLQREKSLFDFIYGRKSSILSVNNKRILRKKVGRRGLPIPQGARESSSLLRIPCVIITRGWRGCPSIVCERTANIATFDRQPKEVWRLDWSRNTSKTLPTTLSTFVHKPISDFPKSLLIGAGRADWPYGYHKNNFSSRGAGFWKALKRS